ncbi:hypothetical protein [Desulfovirgula thermocuniculi]|uniref:hypothetical protein n=1 Tax=Desulfovirgula thermocuniculi TaxID=348842 RepID=UPI00041DCC10|nr:hypothetical protein [Desulfovirgula thermocuniculi]
MAEKLVKYQGDTTQRELWLGGPVVNTGVSRLLDPTDRSFTAVMFQQGKPPLDSEVNLLQQIQNHLRAQIMRQLMPSGIVSLGALTTGVTSPLNCLRLGETYALVNGWLVKIAGANRSDTANDIIFPEAPISGYRDDLAFVEFWFEEVAPTGSPETDSENVYKYGGVQSGTLTNDLQDTTIGDETTRRIQLRWRIRTVADVDFVNYPDGVNHGDKVKAWGGAGADTTYTFSPSNTDSKLYVAGDGSEAACDALKCATGYVYALSLFKVHRRNQTAYDAVNNPDGAPAYGQPNPRPDQLFHNVIAARDVTPTYFLTDLKEYLSPGIEAMGATVMELARAVRSTDLELDKWKKQRLQQGTVTIYNKLVVEGAVINGVPNSRNIQVTKTGTYTAGNVSRVYVDGKDVLIPDEQNVAAVPTNPDTVAKTYYTWLDWDASAGRYKVYLGTAVPEGKLKLYQIMVPAGDQGTDLSACTFTDQRRLEPGHPNYYNTKPFALVSPAGYPMLDTPDYDVLLTVESASDLDKVGRLEVYDKASNGFKIRLTGTADNVQVRWTIVNPDIA